MHLVDRVVHRSHACKTCDKKAMERKSFGPLLSPKTSGVSKKKILQSIDQL